MLLIITGGLELPRPGNGLSQGDLARLAQIHRNSISALEAGEGSGPSVAERLSVALDARGIAFEAGDGIGVIRYRLGATNG